MTELRPGDLNLADPDALLAAGISPHDYFTVLRNEDPVHWNPAPEDPGDGALQVTEGFFVLTRWADIRQASQDTKTFSSYLGSPVIWDVGSNPLFGLEIQRAGIMGQDPPHHTKMRRLVQPGFTPKVTAQLEPVIREHARKIVDEVRGKGQADAVWDIASELPVIMFCELLGIPAEDRSRVRDWGNAIAQVELSDGSNLQAATELGVYSLELIKAKREHRDGSALDAYVNTPIDGELLTDVEIAQFVLTLSIAGHETTRNTALHFLRLMQEFPDQLALLREDLEGRLPNAIEEVLRFSPPVVQFRRTATVDTEVRGVPIKAGQKVYLAYPSGNRDEEMFEDPQRFDILRANAKKHLSFGIGAHFCLGAPLARMQLRCLLEEVLRAMPDLRLTEPPSQLRSIWFNALLSMPIAFTPSVEAAA